MQVRPNKIDLRISMISPEIDLFLRKLARIIKRKQQLRSTAINAKAKQGPAAQLTLAHAAEIGLYGIF